MAQKVIIKNGDRIERILLERGVQRHELHRWYAKLRQVNPHIGNLDRIRAGDPVLIPDQLNEVITEHVIWENAFSAIPQALRLPWAGNMNILLSGGSDTIDSMALRVFDGTVHSTLSPNTLRAVFLANNLSARAYLNGDRLPPFKPFVGVPVMLKPYDVHYWKNEITVFGDTLNQLDPTTRELFQEAGPQNALSLAEIIALLSDDGFAVGADDILRGASYGLAGVSGYAASSNMALSSVRQTAQRIFTDAVNRFGPQVATSKKAAHLRQVDQFIRSHQAFPGLMRQVQELPNHLFSSIPKKIVPPVNSTVPHHVARHFRKEYFQAFQNQSASRYMNTIAHQLKGRVSTWSKAGRFGTWYVPAVLGLYNVATASPEMRMRTLFEEGFGVLGGAVGTHLGMTAGLGIAFVLGLGPFGLFIAVFVCATAGGILLYESGKWFGGSVLHDGGLQLMDRYYNSLDNFFESCGL
jgi:hypothetical protein